MMRLPPGFIVNMPSSQPAITWGRCKPTRNWIGTFGAEVAAAGFGLVGWSCLVLPLFLARAAWVRLSADGAPLRLATCDAEDPIRTADGTPLVVPMAPSSW